MRVGKSETAVGFIIYWYWPDVDIVFIEHFAIDPARRGQQLGQQDLTNVMEIKTAYFLLETELPTDDIRQRRNRFYEQQGFTVNEFAYAQTTALPTRQTGHPHEIAVVTGN